MGAKRGVHFDVSEDLVGCCAYDAHGTPLTDATMAKAQAVDAVLLGAVGGPKYDKLVVAGGGVAAGGRDGWAQGGAGVSLTLA